MDAEAVALLICIVDKGKVLRLRLPGNPVFSVVVALVSAAHVGH